MPGSMLPTNAEYMRLSPEIVLTLLGTLVLFLEAILKENQKKIFAPLTIVGLAGAIWASVIAGGDPGKAFHDMMNVDGFATFFRVLVIGVGLLAGVCASEDLGRGKADGGGGFRVAK